jgi:polyribonucleotide nucleotidyltransferase
MQKWEMTLGGRPLVIEYGKVAKQANAAVLVRYGDTVVLVSAVMATKPRDGIDFFPLLVDYEDLSSGKAGPPKARYWPPG